MRCSAFAVICALLLVCGGAQGEQHDTGQTFLTVHVSGDTVTNDDAAERLEVRGNVRVLVYTSDPDSPRAAIHAEGVQVDLAANTVGAQGGVLLRTDRGAFRGESLHFDLAADELKLTRAAASVDVPRPDGEIFRGYFFGDQIEAVGGSQLIIINGMITPCDSEHRPDIAASAARVVYDTDTGKGTVYGGKLHLLGTSIPLISAVNFRHGGRPSDAELQVSLPGYNGYDGIYLPVGYDFTAADNPWQASIRARVATRSHIRGVASLTRNTEAYDLGLYVSRHQHMTDNITRRLTVSQVPELKYVRRLDVGDVSNHCEMGIDLGRFHERDPEPGSVTRSDARLSGWLGYMHNPEQRTSRNGYWWGATVTQNLYDKGSRFRDFSLETGVGGPIGSDLSGSLSLIEHQTSGRSSFLFDDVDIEREAYSTLKWQMSPLWAFYADGRYDLKNSSLRDYGLQLSRRSHYLTFSVRYDFSEKSVGLRVDINGLTGDTKPAQTTPVVTDQEVQMTPEWVYEQAYELMQSSDPARIGPLF